MRRLLLVLLFVSICSVSFAQTVRYRASFYAIGERTYSGRIVWGDWEDCKVIITIDFDNDFIKVYSSRPQNYVIVSCSDSYHDKQQGTSIDMKAVDEEGIECDMCLRIKDGISQLYSYYENIAWVYSNLVKL